MNERRSARPRKEVAYASFAGEDSDCDGDDFVSSHSTAKKAKMSDSKKEIKSSKDKSNSTNSSERPMKGEQKMADNRLGSDAKKRLPLDEKLLMRDIQKAVEMSKSHPSPSSSQEELMQTEEIDRGKGGDGGSTFFGYLVHNGREANHQKITNHQQQLPTAQIQVKQQLQSSNTDPTATTIATALPPTDPTATTIVTAPPPTDPAATTTIVMAPPPPSALENIGETTVSPASTETLAVETTGKRHVKKDVERVEKRGNKASKRSYESDEDGDFSDEEEDDVGMSCSESGDDDDYSGNSSKSTKKKPVGKKKCAEKPQKPTGKKKTSEKLKPEKPAAKESKIKKITDKETPVGIVTEKSASFKNITKITEKETPVGIVTEKSTSFKNTTITSAKIPDSSPSPAAVPRPATKSSTSGFSISTKLRIGLSRNSRVKPLHGPSKKT